LERAAGLRREDTDEERLSKLEAVLVQGTNDLAQAVPLLADLLSIPTGDRYPPLYLSPQKRKEKTLRAELTQVEGLAARQPVLMVFEDIHWSDPTTRESLDLLIDRIPSLRVLLILTLQPDFAPPWVGRPQVTLLSLNRLPPRQRAKMIAHVSGGKPLPKEIADQIIDRTDGVPLFVEELTKAVIESGVLTDTGEQFMVTGPVAPLAIPTSLHASLLARLDRLAPAREVAQIGAALGRSFSHELISAVAPMPQQQLDDALAQLVRAELIFRRGMPPDAEYSFKHALVQDAAYSILLRGARQQLHARIAQALEARFPEVATTQPELLAHHCAEGGLAKRAVDYWLAAGERALRASANVEAIKHLSQGLRLLSSLPDTPERNRKELRFQTALGPAVMATRGWAVPEAVQAYRRADELSRALDETSERFKIALGLWIFHAGRCEFRQARELSDELFRLAEQENEDRLRLEAHHSAWGTFTWLGEFATCREHVERGLALYDPVQHAAYALTYVGHDPGVCGWALGSVDLWFLGYPRQAAEYARRAVALAEQMAHPPTVAHALHFGLLCHQLRRDEAVVRAWGERLAHLAVEHGLAHYETTAIVARGWVLANQGRAQSSLPELCLGLDRCLSLGMRVLAPYYKALLSEAHLAAGEAPAGLELLEEAMHFAEESGARYWDAQLMRLKGTLLAELGRGSPQEVEGCYLDSLAVARSQQARSLELRAATSLARPLARPRQAHRGSRSARADLRLVHGRV
jgi:predicted ATPase